MKTKAASKSKITNFSIQDKMYNRSFDVYIGNREECSKKILKRYKLTLNEDEQLFESDGCSLVLKSDDCNYHNIIWLSFIDIELLVHECFHAISAVLNAAGIKHTEETEETYAYYVGFLVREIMNKLHVKVVI